MAEDSMTSTQQRAAQRSARNLAELNAARSEIVTGITDLVDFHVQQMHRTPDEAVHSARETVPHDLTTRLPEQVQWSDVGRLREQDPAAGQALWSRIKDAARHELYTGARTGKTLEPRLHAKPWDRARFAVIDEALAEALNPRDGLEVLLVHQMAAAYVQQLTWQERAVQRTEEEGWTGERDRRLAWERLTPRQQERVGNQDGWLPERMSDAGSIEMAVMLADRFQRSFLRLLRAFRDNRRLFGSLVVTGGQVNVAERQVNVQQEAPS